MLHCPSSARLMRSSGQYVSRNCARLRWHLGRHHYKGARW